MTEQVTDPVEAGNALRIEDDSPLSAKVDEQDAGDSLRLGATVCEDGSLVNVVESTGPQPAGEDGQVVKNYETRGGRRRIEVTGPDHDRVREIYAATLAGAGANTGSEQ